MNDRVTLFLIKAKINSKVIIKKNADIESS